METARIKELLNRYFEGLSTPEEEKLIGKYFKSAKVAEELMKYAPFFNGMDELSGNGRNPLLESEIMDFILESEHKEKTKYRWLWQTVTGVAAAVIIVLGGFLFWQQQKPADTFKNPQEAYVYAEKTLHFVSEKYNKGFAALSKFDKLQKATEPVKKGVAPVNKFYRTIERMNKQDLPISEENKKKETDSI